MTHGFRTWDERQADAQLIRAKAEKLKAEAAISKAKAATDQLAEELRQTRLRKQLDAVNDDAADVARERKQGRRQASVDSGARFKRLVTTIIVLGMLASLPGQISYFFGLGRWLLLPVPFFCELLAWAGVEGTKWAHRKGLARWPFWILTGSLAGFAGFINATKGTAEFGPVAGYVLAAASVVGPLLAEVQQYLESKTAADGRSFEERARDRAENRKRAAARREQEGRDAKQDTERKRLFPDTWERYEHILAMWPRDAITREQAWEDATRSFLFPEVWKLYVKLLTARPGAWADRATLWGRRGGGRSNCRWVSRGGLWPVKSPRSSGSRKFWRTPTARPSGWPSTCSSPTCSARKGRRRADRRGAWRLPEGGPRWGC
ncbi:hypothetical protein ACFQ2B_27825 [Streptomyces stramineus]